MWQLNDNASLAAMLDYYFPPEALLKYSCTHVLFQLQWHLASSEEIKLKLELFDSRLLLLHLASSDEIKVKLELFDSRLLLLHLASSYQLNLVIFTICELLQVWH